MKQNLKERVKSKNGITLIALIITIVVLLILAGISISILIGENGLLKRTSEAKEQTEIGEEKEGVELAVITSRIGDKEPEELNQKNLQKAIDDQFGLGKATVIDNCDGTFTVSFSESKRDYNIISNRVESGIDWNKAMANAVAPESQNEERNDGVIGIGTDGNPVNMDLWEYTRLDDGTYGLNTVDGLDATGASGRNTGYKGDFTDKGEIKGTIPTYISIDSGKKFDKVTSLIHTFYNCSDLKIAPKIPDAIEDMSVAFYKCDNLLVAPNIPSSVTKLSYTFSSCTKLESMPEIGNSVKDFNGAFQSCSGLKNTTRLPDSIEKMDGAFYKCINLIDAPNIPINAISLSNTFQGCTKLVSAPLIIPENVENMQSTFQDCIALKSTPKEIPVGVKNLMFTFANCENVMGSIKIQAEANKFDKCFWNCSSGKECHLFLSGTSSVLEELLKTKSTSSNIEIVNL